MIKMKVLEASAANAEMASQTVEYVGRELTEAGILITK